ncbi:hypothetical protein EG329_002946 [Mollisiaceae sp. DMI_Dod_QoI]|nr:hypothetical protein EG329_002946 [Helotiales sp. DMI_Dod_QoI]
MNFPRSLYLGYSQPGRRIGITRPRGSAPKPIDDLATTSKDTMPTKPPTKPSVGEPKKVQVKPRLEDEEDINRLPESSSEDDRPSPNIKSTIFLPGSSTSKPTNSAAGEKGTKYASKGGLRDGNGNYKGTGRPPSTRGKGVPPSSASKSSPKRKSPRDEETTELGAGMKDDFGFTSVKAKKKQKYGYGSSSQSRPSSSQPTVAKRKADLNRDPPKVGFKKPGSVPSSPEPEATPRKSYQIPQLDATPDSTPRSVRKFQRNSLTPLKEDKQKQSVFQLPDLEDIDDSFNISSTDPDNTLPTLPRLEEESNNSPPASQMQAFVAYDFDDSVLETAEALVEKNKDGLSPITALDDDLDLTMTQKSRCPMCNALVDPADIRAYGDGDMNIRMQEKFCRAHRTKTAKQEWEERDYPTINWNKLDSRIKRHHSLIRKMVKGDNSYYRKQMEEKVNAGKDRSLMKMTTNLTPGYYGARGLRAISENIMHAFTPLLKRRMVEDKLMSARGFTPYVQSVLVPEVASRLIQEDMKVDLEKARDILTESIEVGELLNEEIRDVVAKTVDDSEDESDEDED